MFANVALVTLFAFANLAAASVNAIYHPTCGEGQPYWATSEECQEAIGALEGMKSDIAIPPMGCRDVAVRENCAVSICDAGLDHFLISSEALAFVAADIHSNCRANGYIGGSTDVTVDDQVPGGQLATFGVHVGKAGKGRPGSQTHLGRKRSRTRKGLDRRQGREYQIPNTGLRLVVMSAEGESQPAASNFGGLANSVNNQWEENRAVANVVARDYMMDGEGNMQVSALTFAANDGHDALDVHPDDRWPILQAFFSLHHNFNLPAFFTVQIWSGDVGLGWMGFNIAGYTQRLAGQML